MEPDEHLLNLSEKGRVEIANEVQPQRRARQPGAAGGMHNSPGSATMFSHVCGFILIKYCGDFWTQRRKSKRGKSQFYLPVDIVFLHLNFNPKKA